RADDESAVAHGKCERTVGSGQRIDFKRRAAPDVVDDANVTRGVIRIDPLPHRAPGIVNAECGEKIAPARRGLGDDGGIAAAVDNAALETASIARTSRSAAGVDVAGIA